MQLIVISPSKSIENETRIVAELFEHGLEIFHLRKPDMRTNEMRKYIAEIPAHFHNRIIVHSHHGLAVKFGLKGVHLTRHHRNKKFLTWIRLRWMKINMPQLFITTSFHKLGSLYENREKFNYVFLSTIYNSADGKFNPGYNEHSLRAALSKSITPVVARGGTNADNIFLSGEIGFAGMVFYSAIWKKEKPVEAFCNLLEQFHELQKAG